MTSISDIVDGHLVPLKFMAEIAAGLVCGLDGNGAPEGYFQIRRMEGNQLCFCNVEILRRIEELINSVAGGFLAEGVQS